MAYDIYAPKTGNTDNNEGKRNGLTCPLCQCTQFSVEHGRVDSYYGITSHKVTLQICDSCGLTLLFSDGRSFFDFD